MRGVSIIICCYNSVQRLGRTLEYASKQDTSFANVEIILVDNNSTDGTAEYATQLWNTLETKIPLHIVDEKKPGLSEARKRGVFEARFDVVIFCDDDNWLSCEYASKAFEAMIKYPNVAVIGGLGIPKYEKDPPEWFEKYASNFATGEQSPIQNNEPVDITFSKGYVYGAGAVFRTHKLRTLYEGNFNSLLTDRTGTSLLSGGDNELCYALTLTGSRIMYCRELQFFHFIPNERMDSNYLLRLNFGFGYSYMALLPYRYLQEGKNLTGYRTNGYYLLLISVLQIIRNDLPRLILMTDKNRFDFKVHFANRMGAIDFLWKNRNKIKRNFETVAVQFSSMKSTYTNASSTH